MVSSSSCLQRRALERLVHSIGVASGSQPLLHGHNIPCRQARQAAAAAAASLGRTRQGFRLRRQVCEGLTGRQEGERKAGGRRRGGNRDAKP